MLGSVEQHEFCISSSFYGWDSFASPVAVVYVGITDVTVAPFNLLEQPTLGMLPVAKDFVGTDIVGKYGEEQGVLAVLAEEGAETREVGTEERVGLADGEVSDEPLALVGLDAVPPTDVGIVLADVVPTLVVLDDAHRPFKGRQAHDGGLRPKVERRAHQQYG